jgi:mRNA interferase RelE/StbE
MWNLIIKKSAQQTLKKLSIDTCKIIDHYFQNRIILSQDPSIFAKPLRNDLKGFWRFRIDKIRIICKFNYENRIITIYAIGHREDIYE